MSWNREAEVAKEKNTKLPPHAVDHWKAISLISRQRFPELEVIAGAGIASWLNYREQDLLKAVPT